MGVKTEYQVKYHGYFPDIIGELNLRVYSIIEPLKPINLIERGNLKAINIYTTCIEGDLWNYYCESFKPNL